MFVTRKSLHSNAPPPLFLGNSTLVQVDSVKYLGITFSSDLSWSLHISNINAKSRKLLGSFTDAFSFVQPPLLFCFILHLLDHILNMHLKSGTPTFAKISIYFTIPKLLHSESVLKIGSNPLILCIVNSTYKLLPIIVS